MAITPTTLTRAAGAAAVGAGLLFVGIQIGHPHLDAASVATPEVVVRSILKMLMAVLALIGITGMYLSQVRRNGVLGLVGFLVLGAAYLLIVGMTYLSAFVMPSLAATAPAYVDDAITEITGGTAAGDIGLLATAIQVQDLAFLAGGLVFGVALFLAKVLTRWASALLALGGVITILLSVMPDAFYRLLAFPNGIALVALGISLWRTAARGDTGTAPMTEPRIRAASAR
jgi:hypothetical protein